MRHLFFCPTRSISIAHCNISINPWKSLWSSWSNSNGPFDAGTNADVIGVIALDGKFPLTASVLTEIPSYLYSRLHVIHTCNGPTLTAIPYLFF
jgi:hypothetical protein